MFSNDNNIETIAQLVEQAKEYLSLKSEYFRLSIVEKTVRLFTVLSMILVLTIVFLLALTYFSFALAFFLGGFIGTPSGFFVVGSIYLLFFIICIVFRKKWIERPLVRFLASILME